TPRSPLFPYTTLFRSPASAEGNHQQDLYRSRKLEVHRADETVVVGPEHAGEAAETARNDEADVLVQPYMIAERSHAGFTLSDSRSEEHTSELQSLTNL